VSTSLDGKTWVPVDGGKVFGANVARSDTTVASKFSKPVMARYVRIIAESWRHHVSMRAALDVGKKCGSIAGGSTAASAAASKPATATGATTNCDTSKVGTGWKLVRRTPGNMHSATDDLAGTQTYGTATGPTGSSAFSVNFETAVPKWREIMLTTGTCNHWMIMSKQAAIGGWYSGSRRQVTKSYLHAKPYTVQAYRRRGNKEDPWLQPETGHSQATALYVEGNYNANGGNGEGAKYQGLNVYVRAGEATAASAAASKPAIASALNPSLPTSSVRAPWTATPLQSPKNDPPMCRNPFISDPESWDCACHEEMVKTCPSKESNSFDAGCYLSLLCANSKVCPSWKAQVCCSDHDERVKTDSNGAAENCADVANNCDHAIVRLNCPRTCGLCTLSDLVEADMQLEDALAGEQTAQAPWAKKQWAKVKIPSGPSTGSPSQSNVVGGSLENKCTV